MHATAPTRAAKASTVRGIAIASATLVLALLAARAAASAGDIDTLGDGVGVAFGLAGAYDGAGTAPGTPVKLGGTIGPIGFSFPDCEGGAGERGAAEMAGCWTFEDWVDDVPDPAAAPEPVVVLAPETAVAGEESPAETSEGLASTSKVGL